MTHAPTNQRDDGAGESIESDYSVFRQNFVLSMRPKLFSAMPPTNDKRNARGNHALKAEFETAKHIQYRNLVVILCRIPYVSLFDKIRPFFEMIFGKAVIDTIYTVNHNIETNIRFDDIKNHYLAFVKEFFSEQDTFNYLVDFAYNELSKVNVQHNVKFLSGEQLLDEYYINLIVNSRKPIASFVKNVFFLRSTINIIAGQPGGGKSLLLMHEALYQALFNSANVHLFISGDMDESAVMARLMAIKNYYLSSMQEVIIKNNIDIRKGLSRLRITVSPYGHINIYDVAREIKNENLDFVIIDYDDKFVDISNSELMYYVASRPYEVMDAYKTGKVILFASQVKPGALRALQYVPLGFLQGSSRKEHIADTILTIAPTRGKANKIVAIKDRHGLMKINQTLFAFKIMDGIVIEHEIKETQENNSETDNEENNPDIDNGEDEPIPF